MQIVLHGDNLVASRERLHQLIAQAKTRKEEIVRLSGDKVTPTDVIQALESQSLFGTDRLVVLENPTQPPSTSGNLVIWCSKELSKTALAKYKSFQAELFKTPKIIFQFLDSLSLKLLHQCLTTEAPELVFYLLSRRISDLIVAKDTPQLLKQAPWQKQRLIAQASRFSLDQLLGLHQSLLDIDISQKTGSAITDLPTSLDLLLAKL